MNRNSELLLDYYILSRLEKENPEGFQAAENFIVIIGGAFFGLLLLIVLFSAGPWGVLAGLVLSAATIFFVYRVIAEMARPVKAPERPTITIAGIKYPV